MPALTLTDLDEIVLAGLKARAQQHGRTLEAEVKVILEAALKPDSFWEKARKMREELAASGRVFSDSVELLREDRER